MWGVCVGGRAGRTGTPDSSAYMVNREGSGIPALAGCPLAPVLAGRRPAAQVAGRATGSIEPSGRRGDRSAFRAAPGPLPAALHTFVQQHLRLVPHVSD